MATCLRPFVSLCDFRVAAACRQPSAARRLLQCRRLTGAPAAAAASAAAASASQRQVSASAASGEASAPSAAAVGAAQPVALKYSTLSAQQQQQVDAYLDILLEWNQNMNLTAVKDRDEAYERHVNDSLALLPAIDRCLAEQAQHPQLARVQPPQPLPQARAPLPRKKAVEDTWERAGGSSSMAPVQKKKVVARYMPPVASSWEGPRLVDVGSGAGLPGIILAIARPEWEVTLLDSLQKRCKFSEAAVAAAGLANVRVAWGRAEEAGQAPALRQAHDVAIARAVCELRVLAELCLPLVRVGGHWVAAKGAAPTTEVAAAEAAIGRLGGKIVEIEEVDSESPEGRRTAIVVAKPKATPAQYPRKPGVPSKKPL